LAAEITPAFGTRYGLLMVYRKPDPQRRLRSIDRNVPDHWVARKAAGGALSEAEQRLFAEF